MLDLEYIMKVGKMLDLPDHNLPVRSVETAPKKCDECNQVCVKSVRDASDQL